MVTRNVVLTEQQSAFVDSLVNSGRFQNASEALRAGLTLLERDEAIWERAKAGVLEGLEQVRRGQFAEGTGEEVMQRVYDRVRKRHGF
jgi:antitoxin ParD1/3/4